MSDQPKSTPEQRAKWREAAALKKARREAGIPPRPYHKSNTTKTKETEQTMSTIAEQCEVKQPEVIETLVNNTLENVEQTRVNPTHPCTNNEYTVDLDELLTAPLADWRAAKDYTDYRKMLEAANARINSLILRVNNMQEVCQSSFQQAQAYKQKYNTLTNEYNSVCKFIQDSIKQVYVSTAYALEVIQNKTHD